MCEQVVFSQSGMGFITMLLSISARENRRRLKKRLKKKQNQGACHPPRNMTVTQFEWCSPGVLEGSVLSQAFK